MKTAGKTVIMWAVLALTSGLVIYGCRSMPAETSSPVTEEALPEAPHEMQPPEDAVVMTHEIEGFEDCAGCHFEGGSDEGATLVDNQHYCSACHELARPLPFDHGDPPNASCILCHRPE